MISILVVIVFLGVCAGVVMLFRLWVRVNNLKTPNDDIHQIAKDTAWEVVAEALAKQPKTVRFEEFTAVVAIQNGIIEMLKSQKAKITPQNNNYDPIEDDGASYFEKRRVDKNTKDESLSPNMERNIAELQQVAKDSAAEADMETIDKQDEASQGEQPGARERARAFLRQLFRPGIEILYADVIRQAKELGITDGTLRNVRPSQGIESHKKQFGGPVYWSLPNNNEVKS
jgi:hypothetical protein